MEALDGMEENHMKPMTALIYDIDGNNAVTVKHVKEMLNSAARALTPVQQYLHAVKALVHKFKNKDKDQQACTD